MPKNMYIDKLDDIVNKYNNISQRTIKIKPVVVKSSTYIDYKNNNKEDPKSNVSDHVRISKYKKIFANGYVQNWSENVFVITKVKNTGRWTFAVSDLKGTDIARMFYKKELFST